MFSRHFFKYQTGRVQNIVCVCGVGGHLKHAASIALKLVWSSVCCTHFLCLFVVFWGLQRQQAAASSWFLSQPKESWLVMENAFCRRLTRWLCRVFDDLLVCVDFWENSKRSLLLLELLYDDFLQRRQSRQYLACAVCTCTPHSDATSNFARRSGTGLSLQVSQMRKMMLNNVCLCCLPGGAARRHVAFINETVWPKDEAVIHWEQLSLSRKTKQNKKNRTSLANQSTSTS